MNKPKLLICVPYEDPILRQKLKPLSFPLAKETLQLIRDMRYSIQDEQLSQANAAWEAASGMAANQWGFHQRLFLADLGSGFEVFINPSYQPIEGSEETVSWEGCFSVPLALGKVRRYRGIIASYQNKRGKWFRKKLVGYSARVFQHETDHLDGLLYDDLQAGKCLHKECFDSIEAISKFRG